MRVLFAGAATFAVSTALAHGASASIWAGDGPWGPYGWNADAGKFHQPQLGTPVPSRAPPGEYEDDDFDGDGVANADDNCLLVANADQDPARGPGSRAARRQYRVAFGPGDVIRLANRWKRKNPAARFRTDRELGEACSGYNANYLRTTKALIASPNARKIEIFEFLGRSGPMFGGAARPFPTGKPTAYDKFGTIPGAPSPSPTKGESLAQDRDGSLARGNMTPSMPICSGYEQAADFFRWLTATEGDPRGDAIEEALREGWVQYEERIGCGSDLQRPVWEQAMRHFWAGKRLYTNARGGRITNRFAASITEHPLYDAFLKQEPLTTLAKESGAHPYADQPETSGQSRHGIIFRGRSYVDGREAIMMDWRGFEAAWPLGPGGHVEGAFGMLIYDECRAIQTGVYNCTAVTDWVVGERRHTYQEGYMPWVVKGPPTVEEYLEAVA